MGIIKPKHYQITETERGKGRHDGAVKDAIVYDDVAVEEGTSQAYACSLIVLRLNGRRFSDTNNKSRP